MAGVAIAACASRGGAIGSLAAVGAMGPDTVRAMASNGAGSVAAGRRAEAIGVPASASGPTIEGLPG
ncbi:hypothetical protein [Sphingomonas sp. VL_57B]|uniref:hypothetical protein n=1 Tax=Sphingomonas sp. VL_57B TaxID=3144220 RepID=UPI0029EEBE40|nr:hypothetical protein [Pseudomonadota bacterium]